MPYCAARSLSRIEIHFFERDRSFSVDDFVEDLPGAIARFGRADGLGEEEQRDAMGDRGEVGLDGLPILFGEQRHVEPGCRSAAASEH